ncbi:exodeoxyribonuclease III [Caulobacter endophyticus]|uniref:exodeoxyribonuclease III n=1 Tax=Caulobacter endophyticus TaxID=2172652 RepID=UPI0018EE51F3|nr:exodeoxyribonuclease III [Caulobacter endophyticus]
MKIATFNINNVRKRLDNLIDWPAEAEPDVLCLQELKTEDAQFPAGPLADLGYEAVWQGQRTWNGVAILARGAWPDLTRRRLPRDPDDTQARYIEAAVRGVLVGCLYLPNGNPTPGPKFDYKLAWFERLSAHADVVRASVAPVVLAGDYNVAPTEADIYRPHRWQGDALLRPEARKAFADLMDAGWTDALRAVQPAGPLWTFWAYLRNRWPSDKGLRLDHLLLTPDLADQLIDAGVDRWVRGQPEASDHAPPGSC